MRREQQLILPMAIVAGLAWIGAAPAEATEWAKARRVTVVTVDIAFSLII